MNATYHGPADCPDIIPVFPLAGVLLLPRAQMPLNVFEPRYLAMVDAALAGSRIVGIIQPEGERQGSDAPPKLYQAGCAGRIVQFAETGDGRYLVSLVGIARFRIVDEVAVDTPFRQVRVSFAPFAADFEGGGDAEDAVDRGSVLSSLRRYTEANGLQMDWSGIETTPNEALVNALSMMAPFGSREKQALLEAVDVKARAEMLVALTEIELGTSQSGARTTLQ